MPQRGQLRGSVLAPTQLRKITPRYPAIGRLGALAPMPRVLPSFLRGTDPIMPEQGSRAFQALERARRRAKGIEVDFGTARQKSPLFGLGKVKRRRAPSKKRKRRRASGKVTCRKQTFTMPGGRRVRRTVCRDSLGRLAKKRKSSRRKRGGK